MTPRCATAVAALFVVFGLAPSILAQGSSTGSISGVVVDADGGIIPGVDVAVRNMGTGETFATVSSDGGAFSVPSLITGTYTVTVSLQGFKTVILNDVVVNAGVGVTVRATLELGGCRRRSPCRRTPSSFAHRPRRSRRRSTRARC